MPFRFWRRVKIAPGVTLNLSRSGTSVSLGPRGAKTTIGHGRVRQTVGLPGTGLFYTRTLPQHGSDPVLALVTAEADEVVPVPWRATIVVMAFLIGVVIGVQPSAAIPFALIGIPVALVLAWTLRRHPAALGLLVGVAIVAVIAFAVEVAVGILAAGLAGGRSHRRRRRGW